MEEENDFNCEHCHISLKKRSWANVVSNDNRRVSKLCVNCIEGLGCLKGAYPACIILDLLLKIKNHGDEQIIDWADDAIMLFKKYYRQVSQISLPEIDW